jgi:hypothetical protein
MPRKKVSIQYGGSVVPDDAAALLSRPGIDGALIGGASLIANEFLAIARSLIRLCLRRDVFGLGQLVLLFDFGGMIQGHLKLVADINPLNLPFLIPGENSRYTCGVIRGYDLVARCRSKALNQGPDRGAPFVTGYFLEIVHRQSPYAIPY